MEKIPIVINQTHEAMSHFTEERILTFVAILFAVTTTVAVVPAGQMFSCWLSSEYVPEHVAPNVPIQG